METRHAAILVVVLYFLVLEACGQKNTFSEHKRLYNYLEENMDNRIRPLVNQSKTISVDIAVHLQGIYGLDEKEQLLESKFAFECHWKYETLAWNVSEFGGIEAIDISPKDVWAPSIFVSNSIDSLFVLNQNRIDMNRISVHYNGDARWYMGANIRTSCQIDISKYPFDTQTCVIVLTKPDLDHEVYFIASNENVSTVLYEDNGEWSLKNLFVTRRTLFEVVTYIDIHLTLSRHSLFYTLNVILPVALLSFMSVLSFKIPTSSGERLSYSMALLLTFVVLLNLISDSMPRVPKHVSYLQLYVNSQLTMAVIITACSIMLVDISYQHQEEGISNVEKLYHRFCKFRRKKKELQYDSSKAISSEKESNGVSDAYLDTIIDPNLDRPTVIKRIGNALFWVFMSLYIISTIVFFILVKV